MFVAHFQSFWIFYEIFVIPQIDNLISTEDLYTVLLIRRYTDRGQNFSVRVPTFAGFCIVLVGTYVAFEVLC